MILRNVALRYGRTAFAIPFQTSFRSLSTEIDTATLSQETEAIAQSIQNTTKQTGSIEAQINQLPATKTLVNHSLAAEKQNVAADYNLLRSIRKRTHKLGSHIEAPYEPSQLVRDPPKPSDVTLELLMSAQSHMGHNTSVWNPSNQRYIFGVREGIHIISLEQTASHLRRAAKVVEGVAYHGGLILFVGTRKGHASCVVKAATLAQGCHLFKRWAPGTITNRDQVLRKCSFRAVDKDDKDIDGFEDKISHWMALKPDLVVCMNPLENYLMLHECRENDIPTIGVIDTNADPTWVTYPIPANDDSLRCTQVIAGVLGRAGEEGQKKRLADAKLGKVSWLPPQGLGRPVTEADKRKELEERKERARLLKEQDNQEEKRVGGRRRRGGGEDEW